MNMKRFIHTGMLLMLSLALALALWGVQPAPVARAANCTSNQSGNWSASTTWINCGGGIPQDSDDVTILTGHTVTVDTNTATLGSLTVYGTLTVGNNTTPRTVTVSGDLFIANGGNMVPGASSAAHTLLLGGDLTNNGTFDGLPAAGRIIDVTFNRNGNQTIKGTEMTRFNILKLNMGTSRDNILDVQAVITLAASTNPLVIQNGTFKLSSNSTITPFTTSAGATIPATGGFWVNGGTVTTGNVSWTLNGLLRVSAGTLTIGTLAGNSVNYNTGSVITIEGGSLSIAGRLGRPTTSDEMTTYSQSGGTVTVVRVGSASTGRAGFDIGNTGSSFTMSGGTIVIQQRTTCNSGDYLNVASTYNVTGGTLQIGNANTPSANTMRINSTVPVGNLTVDGSTSGATKPTAQLFTKALTVKSNVTVQAGTTLDANNLDLTVGGNWTNDGTFTAGSGMVTFNGSSEQTISGSSTTAFNNLTVNSGATVVIPATNIPTVAASVTNNGTLKQTLPVNGGPVQFLKLVDSSNNAKYLGVDITSTNDMGNVTVSIRGNQYCTTNTLDPLLKRCFDISPQYTQSATIKFYYTEAERNGQAANELKVWHYNNPPGQWSLSGTSYTHSEGDASCSQAFCWVEAADVSAYSPFTVGSGDAPTAVNLSQIKARPSFGFNVVLVIGILSGGLLLLRRRRA